MATEILRPNADGDTIALYNNSGNELTEQIDNYSYVDEVEADDNDNVMGGNDNQIDLYQLENPSVSSGTINKITLYARVITYSPPDDSCRILIKTGEVNYYSDSITTEAAIFELKSNIWETNPNTEIAWTWDDIGGLQVGIEVNSGNGSGSRLSQIYLEVDYSEEEESLGDIVLSLTDNKLTVTSGADEATYSITDNKITLATGGNNYTFNPFESPYLKSMTDNLLTIDGSILTPDS
jgi:hypothetical protein